MTGRRIVMTLLFVGLAGGMNPRLPRVAVMFAVHPRFRVGAAGSFDASRFTHAISAAVSPSGGVSIPMQIALVNADKVEWTLSLEPGAFLLSVPIVDGSRLVPTK